MDALASWRLQNAGRLSAPPRRVLPGTCAVYVRKRPMSERDARKSDFDVLTVLGVPAAGEGVMPVGQEIVHHACVFDKSAVKPAVLHTSFPYDGVFDTEATSEDVYDLVGRPLLQNALEGSLSTLFMFGQTGSGKTFTMRAIERETAEELFDRLGPGAAVALSYFELVGKKALDLLREEKEEVRLREEEDGCFRPHCEEVRIVTTADEMLRVMAEAAARRATDATTVNSVSSRSHAVCRITLLSSERKAAGRVLLVDCAGTERSKDSMYFKGSNVKESAEINSSLFALKDCIRFRQAAIQRHGGMPQEGQPLKLPSVRATPLTKVLAESLISPSAQLAVVATVSPNATDAEHTIETLRTVYTLSGRGEARLAENRQVLE